MFAAKSQLEFEPQASVDLGSVAVGHLTPAAWRHTLGGLAVMNGVKATLKYKLVRDGGAAVVDFEINVKTSGGVTVHTESLTGVAAGATVMDAVQVDVGAVSGGSPLMVEVNVTTADAGTTADLWAAMEYETPVIVAGC